MTKHSAKTSKRSEIINRLESGTHRSTVAAFKIALFAIGVATLNQLLIHGSQQASIGVFVLANVKAWIIAVVSLLATVVGSSYVFSILLTRRTRSTTALKKKVVEAYLQALDESSFNPHSLNKQHEQLNK
jgi:hypothetical protein